MLIPTGYTAPRTEHDTWTSTDHFELLLLTTTAEKADLNKAHSQVPTKVAKTEANMVSNRTTGHLRLPGSLPHHQQQQLPTSSAPWVTSTRAHITKNVNLSRTQHKQRKALKWDCAASHAPAAAPPQVACQLSQPMLNDLQHYDHSACDTQYMRHPRAKPTQPDPWKELFCTLTVPHAGHQATATGAQWSPHPQQQQAVRAPELEMTPMLTMQMRKTTLTSSTL